MNHLIKLLRGIGIGIKRSILILSFIFLILPSVLPIIKINGSSMEPTIKNGSYIIAIPPVFLSRDDVCCFALGEQMFIKRIVAVEGDIVNILEGGTVTVNGKEYAMINNDNIGSRVISARIIEKDSVFVIGDNLNNSYDSRYCEFGDVTVDNVYAQAIAVIGNDREMIRFLW